MPLAAIQNVSIFNGKRALLRDVSFNLEKGESYGLIGESGSGKTLLATYLLGLLSPNLSSVGSYTFDNELIQQEKDYLRLRREDIAMVVQNPQSSLNPTMKIKKQLLEVACEKHAINKLMHDVHLGTDLLHRYPHELSGGQKQRVVIAMAIARSPKLIIADEPTTALDVETQAHILDLLQSLQRKNKFTLLFITHDLALMAKVCHKAFVCFAGKIVERASVQDILHIPKHPYTQALIHSYPTKSFDMNAFKLSPSKGRVYQGCAFVDRCPHAMHICAQKEPLNKEACWLAEKDRDDFYHA